MKKDWKKTKIIYYSDELNDDFDKTNLTRPEVPSNYKYIRSNPINNFFSNILYYGIAVPIIRLGMRIHGIKVEGKENIKIVKNIGVFYYANHVSFTDMVKYHVFINPFKRMNILGYSDTLSIPVVKHIARALGYLPLPNEGDLNNLVKLNQSIEYYIREKKQNIVIFPEAHVWPYYTRIRNFKSTSFYYPALTSSPVVPVVTVWRKSRLSKKPKQTIIIGKPIHPRNDMHLLENKQYLYEECLKQMKQLSLRNTYEYIKYIKK